MTLISVCLLRGAPQLYSYSIPEGMSVETGDHVDVPFGRGRCEGLVMALEEGDGSDLGFKVKSILGISATLPRVCLPLMELLHWFITHYDCAPYKAYQTVIGKRKLRELSSDGNWDVTPSPHTLTSHQEAALQAILKPSIFSKHLIHGITGSGKTEIYMRLAEQCIASGKQIIICCPEISLTPQFREQFTQRFHGHVVVMHSGLTPKQRDLCWSALYTGKASVCIGPRSAVFSPCQNLGMIVIDEEHDSSYKQDSHPRYWTHEVAEQRCKTHNCQLVLGSATPSITTFLTTQKSSRETPNSHSYTHLPSRAAGSSLPSVDIVDMRNEAQAAATLSSHLIKAIETRLQNKEKVLLLMNRRGYAPYIQCQSCKHIHACPDCQLSYTYHKDKYFRCHRCDTQHKLTHVCSNCQKPRLEFGGQGIQKTECDLQQHFPEASIVRLDKDTAKTAKQLETQLNAFKQTGDILLGTQLIAKGHHIEDITLVGVLGIDTQLNIPDFTSAERSFQLLTQVAGRAGRGSKKGHVIIQTNQPDHYAVQCAQTHAYEHFIEHEAQFRLELNYPPFGELTHVILSCPSETTLKRYTTRCKTLLANMKTNENLQIIGPKPAPIEKIRNHYRWHLLFKHFKSNAKDVRAIIASLPKAPQDLRVITDFSPLQLL